MSNVSIAQRAAWLRLRSWLSEDLLTSGAATRKVSQVLKAFDALPYGAQEPTTLWLPTLNELHLALTPLKLASSAVESLAREAETEAQALQCLARGDSATLVRKVQISDPGDGLHWVGLGTEVGSFGSSSRLNNDAKKRGRLAQVRFPLVDDRLRWLRSQHEATAVSSNGRQQQPHCEETFLSDLFRMLVRYDGLGGGASGSGNQAAVPAGVFAAMERWAKAEPGTCVEAFASPLNHRLDRRSDSSPAWFCSAFRDVDAAFGSSGSFLNFNSLGRRPAQSHHSILLLNPPFFASHMEAIPGHLNRLFGDLHFERLRSTSSLGHQRHASALVVVSGRGVKQPAAAPHREKLLESPWFRGSLSLAGGSHSFEHGLQHCRSHDLQRRALRPSYHETDVFVLSTFSTVDTARDTTGTFESLLEAVTDAFSVLP
jgi:hypothetical protein